MRPISFSLLWLAALLLHPDLHAQQVKNTGTSSDLPLKTVVIKDGKSDDAAGYFASNNIIRFWIYKAGSTADVERLVRVLRAREGVTALTEEGVSGDYIEFVLKLKTPRNQQWFEAAFREAGLTHLQFNGGKAAELSKR